MTNNPPSVYYPSVDANFIAILELLALAYSADPLLSASPYPQEIREHLTKAFCSFMKVSAESTEVTSVEDFSEQELINMVKTLRTLETSDLDAKEHANIIKVKAQLVERLTLMLERVVNIKRLNEFESRVLNFLDDLLTPEQKEILVDKLKDL